MQQKQRSQHAQQQSDSHFNRRWAVPKFVLAYVLTVSFITASFGMVRTSAAESSIVGENDIYQYAGECVVLFDKWSNRYLTRDYWGYAVTSVVSQATPLRMQATDLGSYLLYTPNAEMPAAGPFNYVAPVRQANPLADWVLTEIEDALQIRNLSTGLNLSVTWVGRLTQNQSRNARWSFKPAEGCSTFPELEVNIDDSSLTGLGVHAEVTGFVDAHVHLTAYDFLGGRFHCGRPWSRYGVAEALKDCPDHGPDGRFAFVENLISYGRLDGLHSNKGWPDFDGWPKPESLTHEVTYWKGIERNWRAGLRILVADLVENRALCEIYWLKQNPCTDMESLRLQAQGLYDLQDYIDAQFKGPGKGFFRIVKTPAEARAVINAGKLAVVIGVETSQPFDCLYKDGVEICTRDQIDRGLRELWDLGVRSLFPVHKFDNAFGGTTMDSGTISVLVNIGNVYLTGRWWEVGTCPGEESDRTPITLGASVAESSINEHNQPQVSMAADVGDSHTTITAKDLDMPIFRQELTAPLLAEGLPVYPDGPVCNVRGLTDLGEYLINRMIDIGMIVETDHLSARARDRALQILEARSYSGVVTSHNWGGAASRKRIQALGGFVAGRAISTSSFSARWREARSTQDSGYLWGYGYGSDANGIAAQVGPRPGAMDDNPVTYPFASFDGSTTIHQSQWANRLWDFNLDGAAHYGLLADWIEDLQNVVGQEVVNDLARGAEAYLQMWERATGG